MNDWKTVKLSDICILEKGQQIDTSLLDDSKPFRYINGGIKESGYFDNFNTSGESVLISEGGASCGYINYVNENFWCGCHCYRLHDIKVFPKYLFHALKANQQRIMALRTGSAMPNIQKSTIQKFELKIHDDSTTQKKVSTMLDKCNELIEKHKQTLEKYDTLIKSRFIEMFGDPVINEKDWDLKTLPELGEFGRGVSKHRPRNAPELLGGKYPLIQTGDVANANLYITDYESTYSEEGFKQSKMWKAGTLCITIAATIAKTAILTFDSCFPDSVVGFTPNEKTNSLFINYWFSFFQKILEEQAPAVAQKNINLQVLSELKIITPPISLQNDFAAFVQQIDKSKFAVQKSLEKAETLYKSLMQEYFG